MIPKTMLLSAAVLGIAAVAANAETLRWARTAEALTLDPHASNEGPTTTFRHQIMETLIVRDPTGAAVPGLATDWSVSKDDPSVWVFNLRKGVKFHDGSTFDSEDVVFSIERAKSPDSDFKELLASVSAVRATGPHRVEIVTSAPNPILPNNLNDIFMMDKQWAEANDTVKVQDYDGGEETFASRNINGTGAYKLVSREADVRTVLRINEDYWGRDHFPMDVTEVVFTPIHNDATRVAALLSGEVDFIQDVPVQDIGRVSGTDGLVVRTAPQNRVIFIGLNSGDADLASDNIEGANPFADRRVRRALNIAINRDAIRRVVMRGQSQPAGVIMPPFVNGWTEELAALPDTDMDEARSLMAEAGYEDGFSITLNCPNDRYINDEAICQAVVGMFARVGVEVNLEALPRAQHFPLITTLGTDFYLLGWGVPTYDSEYIFNFLVHTKGDKYGSWNATRFGDPEVDRKIVELASMTDIDARNASIAEIWERIQEEILYLPIHYQVLNWGMKSNVKAVVSPNDRPDFKYVELD